MKIYAMIGALVVIFALLFYTIGFAKEQRKKIVTAQVLLFFTMGVFFDVSATILMMMGASKGVFTLHGLLGYSALLGMCTDTFLLWRHKLKKGLRVEVSKFLNIFSRIAYIWWIAAFITGGILVALRHTA